MKILRLRAAVVFAVTLSVATSAASWQNSTAANSNPASQTILCRALEVKMDPKTAVTVVLFHQASKADGPALGELLRSNEGANVEFVTSDGKPHSATLFRLDTCFGRGLLIFSTATARLSSHEQFSIRAAVRG